MKIYNEYTLRTFLENDSSNFWKISGFDIRISGVFSGKRIGNVDLIIKRKQTEYFIEIKLNRDISSSDFWSALKVIGYVEAAKLINPHRNIKPCIMVRKEIITNDFLAILGSLNISYITIDLDNEKPQFSYFLGKNDTFTSFKEKEKINKPIKYKNYKPKLVSSKYKKKYGLYWYEIMNILKITTKGKELEILKKHHNGTLADYLNNL